MVFDVWVACSAAVILAEEENVDTDESDTASEVAVVPDVESNSLTDVQLAETAVRLESGLALTACEDATVAESAAEATDKGEDDDDDDIVTTDCG